MPRRWLALAGAAACVACLAACGSASGLSSKDQVFVVGSDGGEFRRLTDDDHVHGAPLWSPDGRWIASVSYRVLHTDERAVPVRGTIDLFSPRGATTRELDAGGYPLPPAWIDSRRLAVVVTPGRYPRNAFTATVMNVAGTILDRTAIHLDPQRGMVEFSWSAGGSTLAMTRVAWTRPFSPTRLDTEYLLASRRQGNPELLARTTRNAVVLAWSPDGKLLYTTGGTIWIRTAGGSSQRVASGTAIAFATWAPDGQTVAYLQGGDELWSMRSDGAGKRLLASGKRTLFAAWAPDGRRLIVGTSPLQWALGNRRISLHSVAASGKGHTTLVDAGAAVTPAVWSPDGRRIAFVGYRRAAIHTMRSDGSDLHTILRLRNATIDDLSWSPDGSQLAFTAKKAHTGD